MFYFLRFEFLMGKFIGESTQTTNIANINTTKLADYYIPLPPLAEQHRIVSRIESLFAKLVLPEELGPAIITNLTSTLWNIFLAMSAILLS